MDDERFDRLAAALAAGPSRRGILRLISGGGLLAALGRAGSDDAAAKKKGKKKKGGKKKKSCKRTQKKCGKRCIPESGCCTSQSCDDDIACTIDSCDEGSNACTSTPDPSRCTTTNPCRVGRCDPLHDDSDENGCVFVPLNLGSVSCGFGPCQRTVPRCVDGEEQQCVPGQPSAEICNGIDDNCNGSIDDGAICPDAANAQGACVQGNCTLTCDAGFGDCDGDSDNGCETDLDTSLQHCGECGNLCGGPCGPGLFRECVAGDCQCT